MTRRFVLLATGFALATGCRLHKETGTTRADTGKEPPVEARVVAEAEPAGAGDAEALETGSDEPESAAADVVAEAPPEIIGTNVTARVASVDPRKKQVVFRIEEGSEDILLQSGKVIRVPFMDLELFTGMPREDAIEALERAGAVRVRVLGEGAGMRIIEIDLEAE